MLTHMMIFSSTLHQELNWRPGDNPEDNGNRTLYNDENEANNLGCDHVQHRVQRA